MGSAARAGGIVLVFGILGFLLALIEQMAYDSGYLLNLYITDAAQLPGLQIITIIIGLLFGAVFAALTQG